MHTPLHCHQNRSLTFQQIKITTTSPSTERTIYHQMKLSYMRYDCILHRFYLIIPWVYSTSCTSKTLIGLLHTNFPHANFKIFTGCSLRFSFNKICSLHSVKFMIKNKKKFANDLFPAFHTTPSPLKLQQKIYKYFKNIQCPMIEINYQCFSDAQTLILPKEPS